MSEMPKLQKLMRALGDARSVLVTTHGNPDPDAVAAAYGMSRLLQTVGKIRTTIGYHGILGRAENRAMVKRLSIKMTPMLELKGRRFGAVVLCDSQPIRAPEDGWRAFAPTAVLDHHPLQSTTKKTKYYDVRSDYGSSSAIVTEYLQEAGVPVDARLATALYYGIKTDISDIARKTHDADLKAMRFLFPKISIRWLHNIEHPRVGPEYFRVFERAISGARIYKDAVVTSLGEVSQSDTVAELADFMIRLKGMKWSFTIGCAGDRMVFSLRSLRRGKEAGRIAREVAACMKGMGGGHHTSAGGLIRVGNMPPEKRGETCDYVIRCFLNELGYDPAIGKPIDGKTVTPS